MLMSRILERPISESMRVCTDTTDACYRRVIEGEGWLACPGLLQRRVQRTQYCRLR
jgi:hypothetical protein